MISETNNSEANYSSYSEWKNWSWRSIKDVPPWMQRYFAGEISKLDLDLGDRILEVGFGQGEFMEWAKSRGFEICGLEIIPDLVERAVKHNFEASLFNSTTGCPIDEMPKFLTMGTFHAIIAFDVIEHMTTAEFEKFLGFAYSILQEGGLLLARFPNAGSPFGLRLQHGDNTHRQALTETHLSQLLVGSGFELVSCDNSFRVVGDGKLSIITPLVFAIRSCIEYVFGYAYYLRRVPMDPALTAILKKKVL